MIGINSDESVKRIKGANRPFQNQDARATILASLLMTDAIVLFTEDDPAKLIRQITPDVLVKGGDYTPEKVIGADHVWAHGGSVQCVPFLEGYSTTNLASLLGNG